MDHFSVDYRAELLKALTHHDQLCDRLMVALDLHEGDAFIEWLRESYRVSERRIQRFRKALSIGHAGDRAWLDAHDREQALSE